MRRVASSLLLGTAILGIAETGPSTPRDQVVLSGDVVVARGHTSGDAASAAGPHGTDHEALGVGGHLVVHLAPGDPVAAPGPASRRRGLRHGEGPDWALGVVGTGAPGRAADRLRPDGTDRGGDPV